MQHKKTLWKIHPNPPLTNPQNQTQHKTQSHSQIESRAFLLLLATAITRWSNWPLVFGHCYLAIGVRSLLLFEPSLFEPLLATDSTRCTKQNKDWTAWEIWSAAMALVVPCLLLPLLVWRVKSVHTSFFFFLFGLGIEVFGGKKIEI